MTDPNKPRFTVTPDPDGPVTNEMQRLFCLVRPDGELLETSFVGDRLPQAAARRLNAQLHAGQIEATALGLKRVYGQLSDLADPLPWSVGERILDEAFDKLDELLTNLGLADSELLPGQVQ